MKELLEEFADLHMRRRDVERELETIKEKIDQIEPQLAEQFGMVGIQNANVKGLCIYMTTDKWVTKKGGVETTDLCQILEDHGLGDMVSPGYSASALKARILAWKEAGVEIPQAITDALNIGETQRLKTRKAT